MQAVALVEGLGLELVVRARQLAYFVVVVYQVAAYGVFRGTHTGEGGPVPPTGKKVEADYVYVMDFDGDRIRHMTKIWNDGISLKQLGWM